MRRVCTFILLFLFLSIPKASAWTPGLMDAAKAVAKGKVKEAQKVFVHIHRGEVSRMALRNKNFQKNVFPKVEKAFNETNQKDIRRIAENFGCTAEAKVSKKGPNPGADTDVAVRPIDPNEKLTLEKIQAMDNYHEDMLKARAQKYGVPFEKSDIDNDFLPHPDYTTDEEFEKIAKYINNEKGGTAYRTRKAAKAEIKLSEGKKLTPDEVGAYTNEMKWQQQRKVAKNKVLFNDLDKARRLKDRSAIESIKSKIQLNQSQQAKYTNRVRRLNETLREEYGLEPLRREITGADGAIDIIDAAGRNVDTAYDAATVGALSDSAMRKAREELADTLIDAGKQYQSARHSLPHVLNDLPPSAQGNMIARMEQELGAEATVDIIKNAKTLKKGTGKAAKAIADKMKSDLNFGKKPEFSGGVTKLQVAMTAMNAVMMAKTGYEITLKNIKPDDSDLDMFGKMMANSLYYGSGVGENFDQSMAEEMERYKKAYLRDEGPSMTGHITATFLKTGMRMGKDTIEGILYLPDGIAHLLAWGRDWATGAGALKEYAYAQNALADAMQKVILEKEAFKEAMDMIGKYGVHPEDARAYLNCLCRDCGGSIGGVYNPGWEGGGHGPCVCSGPLSMWKTPVNTDKKTALNCFNSITENRYNQDQSVFQKWQQMARETNAESVEPAVQQIRSKIAVMDENWQENAVNAAKIFNRIKPMMLDEDIEQIQKVLTPRLINAAHHNMVDKGDLKKGISRLELARKTGGKETLIERRIADYKRWEKTWGEVLSKNIPQIKNLIRKGNLKQAMSRMQNVQLKMSTQGGNYYPPTSDPRWLALTDLYNQKSDQLKQDRTAAMKKNLGKKANQPKQHLTQEKFRKIQGTEVSGNSDQTITLSKTNIPITKTIRLLITQLSTRTAQGKNDSARIGEVEFYSKGKKIVPSSVEAESTYSGYSPQQAADGDREYRFSSQGPRGWASVDKKAGETTWIAFQFNQPILIDQLIVTTAPSNPYRLHSFHLETAPMNDSPENNPPDTPESSVDFSKSAGSESVESGTVSSTSKPGPSRPIKGKHYEIDASEYTHGEQKELTVKFSGLDSAKRPWIGIYTIEAPDKKYTAYQYTPKGAGAGELKFALPKQHGQYNIRIFYEGYKLLETSPAIVIHRGTYTVTPEKQLLVVGKDPGITVRYECAQPAKNDWVGIYKVGEEDKKYVSFKYTDGTQSGKVSIALPNDPGKYELRLFHTGYKRLAVANQPVTLKSGNASVKPDKGVYAPGECIVARFERPLDRDGDWIGVYKPAAPDKKYIGYVYTKNPFSGSVQINAPNEHGTYELRLYHSGYKFIVKSSTFEVK